MQLVDNDCVGFLLMKVNRCLNVLSVITSSWTQPN